MKHPVPVPLLLRLLVPLAALAAPGCPFHPIALTNDTGIGPATDAGPAGTDAAVPQLCDPVVPPPGATVMTLDTAGPGGALALGAACDPAANACAPGTLCCAPCCLPDAPFTCTAPDPSGSCPLPDVLIDEPYLASSVSIEWQSFGAAACEIAEACVDASGMRRLLRFGIQLPNVGTTDMHIGTPDPANDNFEFSACHGHYHFEDYGRFRLLALDGCEAARGHKNGFCVLDLAPYSPDAGPGQYGCGDMGITVGWSDIYGAGTDCQWVDITDVPAGDYLLEAIVNFDWRIPESDYANNVILVPVTIPPEAGPPPPGDPLAACPSPMNDEARDCGWFLDGTYPCTPGETITVGCNADCAPPIGACTGDAMIRICAGPMNPCTAASSIGGNDDACGTLCPSATAVCPAPGAVTVLTGPYASGLTYTCTVELQ